MTHTSTSVSTSTLVSDITTLNSNDLPFARSIPVVAQVQGFKPFTSLYAFNDSDRINANIYPCAQLTITGEVGKFLGYDDVSPGNAWSLLRNVSTADYQGNIQSLYPKGSYFHGNILGNGEIIRYYENATNLIAALVISREIQVNIITKVATTVLHVLLMNEYTSGSSYTDNFISSIAKPFPIGAVIKGDSSGATATISAVYSPAVGVIDTNSLGNFYGMYIIPAGTVRIGSHQIAFSDSTIYNSATAITEAETEFTSHGKLNVFTDTITTRVDTRINAINLPHRRVRWWDPLAQTFIAPTEKKNGCFLTSVDLYFSSKASNETQPVIVQITDTVNGYPGQNIIASGTSQMNPDQITTSQDGSVATNFKFDGPVFIEPGIEYCIKILSNSIKYKVWIAEMGDKYINDPTKIVVKAPYLGVLFKSQNNSTWTANQTQDLKFVLKYAEFDISKSGLMTVQNQNNAQANASLPPNPFSVSTGQTTAKVYYPNHGLVAGTYTKLTGSIAPALAFNNTYKVDSVLNTDTFLITLPAASAYSGLTGGDAVKATKSIKYDTLNIDLGLDYSIRTGTNLVTTTLQSTSAAKDIATISVNINKNLNNDASRFIHSDLNEGLLLSGRKSLDVNLNIFSSSKDLSPIINRNTLAATLVSNKINNPSYADNTVVDNLTLINALAGVTFALTTNIITIPVTVDINQFKTGAYLKISGTTSNNTNPAIIPNNEAQILNIDKTSNPFKVYVSKVLVTEAPATTTLVQQEGFIDEISPVGGTSESKYITDAIALTDLGSSIKILFSASIEPSAEVKVYYRTTSSTSSALISEIKWEAVPMLYRKSQGREFIDQAYLINTQIKFNIAQFKIVLISTDTSQIPHIKDFRAICLA